jgi:hypothetical protein
MKAIELLKGRRLFRLNWNIVDITRYTKVKRLERKEPAKDAGDLETLEQFEYVMENKVSVGEISPIVTRGYRDIWA